MQIGNVEEIVILQSIDILERQECVIKRRKTFSS